MWKEVTPTWLKEEIVKLEDKIKRFSAKSSPRTQAKIQKLQVELEIAQRMLARLEK